MSATTTITYGSFSTDSTAKICTAFNYKKRYDSFDVSGTIKFTYSSQSALQTALDAAIAEFRKIDQNVKITINGVDFIDANLGDGTGFVIRGDASVAKIYGTSADLNFSLEGRLPPQDQPTAKYYPFTMNFSFTQAERVHATFSGVYTASSTESASDLYSNGSTGAEARCAALLNTYFSGRDFDLVSKRITYSEESDKWLNFTLDYAEAIIPNANEYYDFSGLTFTRVQSEYSGLSSDERGTAKGSYLAGALTSPGDPPQKWNVSGAIPVKSLTYDYDDLVELWETSIKPALWNLLKDYFFPKVSIPSGYSQAFIENENVNFDVVENAISVNFQITIPSTSGIISLTETCTYRYNPNIIAVPLVNGKEDFAAWIGKLPDTYICEQTATVRKFAGFEDYPPPPPIPEWTENVAWVQIAPASVSVKRSRFRIVDQSLRTILVSDVTYSTVWQLVNTTSFTIHE